jgi:hypothetical protein
VLLVKECQAQDGIKFVFYYKHGNSEGPSNGVQLAGSVVNQWSFSSRSTFSRNHILKRAGPNTTTSNDS